MRSIAVTSFEDKKYRSCPHVDKTVVTYSVQRLQTLRPCSFFHTHVCVSCSFTGKLSDSSFRSHLKETRHNFCLRIRSTPELFCLRCNDYQYCSYLDQRINRKRTLSGYPDDVNNEPKYTKKVESLTSSETNQSSRRGLVNMGATCFMNSVLQVLGRNQELMSCKQLCEHPELCTLSKMKKGDGESSTTTDHSSQHDLSSAHSCIPCEFKAVADSLTSNTSDEVVVIPSHLLFAIWNFVDYMAGYAQQDAHEFLIAFLSSIDAQLKNHCEQTHSFTKMYSGLVQSSLTCLGCGDVSKKKETFVDLNLSLESFKDESSRKRLSSEAGEDADDNLTEGEEIEVGDDLELADCLRFFTDSEILSSKLFCEKCGSNQDKKKQLNILESPEVIILHLKRFDFMAQKKLVNKVHFPIRDLDITPYSSNSTIEPGLIADPLRKYELQGVVCHEGTLHQGHYISYIRDKSNNLNQWIKCDDEKVTTVTEDEVRNAEAYLLFYTKQKNTK